MNADSGGGGPSPAPRVSTTALASRIFALSVVAVTLAFVLNDYLIFWRDWPGAWPLFSQWLGLSAPAGADLSAPGASARAWLQASVYLAPVVVAVFYAFLTPRQPLRADAARLSALAAYLVRASFWTVLLIGFVDMLISFLRVEDLLAAVVGEHLTRELGRSVYRGTWVHMPLMGLAFLIALRTRGLDFIWLAFLVVLAEFQIVISRFVFSYEQAFMGDLVRFWYASLFLLGSAYALVDEGHVRVDVFYARFSPRTQAWSNLVGSVVLGIPLCWTILATGMWGKGSSINSPLLSFEISQSGFGMYVKYLMAGLLVMFAVSMAVQFMSYTLSSIATLRGEEKPAGAG